MKRKLIKIFMITLGVNVSLIATASGEPINTIKAPNCNIAIGTGKTLYDSSESLPTLIRGLKAKGYNQVSILPSLFNPNVVPRPASEIYFYLTIDAFEKGDAITYNPYMYLDIVAPIRSTLGPNKVKIAYTFGARVGDQETQMSILAKGSESKVNYFSDNRNTLRLTRNLLEAIPDCAVK